VSFKQLLALFPEKHQHRRDIPGQAVANRLEIHPLALRLLPAAKTIYFALEGTPKADAILSRIIATGERASVFDVPSVTLWRDPGLKQVAQTFLRGLGRTKPLVVIVVDADYRENDRVMRQALLLRETLRSYGTNTCVAAPPADLDAEDALLYKGVDDFLAAGGKLEALVVLEREAPFSLALYAQDDGTISGSPLSLAPLLGCRRSADRVVEKLKQLLETGFVSADRSLELVRDEWTGAFKWKGARDDWPTFAIDAERRYADRLVSLREFADSARPSGLTIAETWALEVVRVFHDAGQSRRWAEQPPDREPRRLIYEEAVAATARRLGKKEKTVRDDPEIARAFALGVMIRDFGILMLADLAPVPEIADWLGVSRSTVHNVIKAAMEDRSTSRQSS
jgi:hypothetical protein